MSKKLLYAHNIQIPIGNNIAIFRNKRDGFYYYKNSANEIVKLIHTDGNLYYIRVPNIAQIINYTNEQLESFLTDEALAISFFNSTQTIVAGGGGGGGGLTTNQVNTLIQNFINVGGDVFAPLFDYYTDATTSGVAETDLYSDIVPANILDTDGKKILAVYGGEATAGAGGNYFYRVYFGGTLIANVSSLSSSDWQITTTLIRSGATTARVLVQFSNAGITFTTETDIAGLDFTVGNILKLTGEVDNALNSITAKIGYVNYMPNAQL